jgi:hypothetical protein
MNMSVYKTCAVSREHIPGTNQAHVEWEALHVHPRTVEMSARYPEVDSH